MRKHIVAGNWKMNLLPDEAEQLVDEILAKDNWPDNVQVIIFPPALYIQRLAQKASDRIIVGAQNFFQKDNGAFTGELSITQIKATGAKTVLIGHSERRAYFGEHESFLKEKVDAAIEHKMNFIFCCGEPLDIREAGQHEEFVKNQLEESLFHLDRTQILSASIAYEPVWAIGTGKTATSAQAEEMHSGIRSWLSDNYGIDVANQISILYGGSCSAANAEELFACSNVDGGLIGGASLDADSFNKIALSF
ncbi:MAG: triosephosphate isomerase [Lentimonas sp.]|jgi:triosephosphate isomerase